MEESLSSQQLWKDTAGTRPPQPVEERDFYERMWTQNFEKSQVKLNSNKSLGSCDNHNKTVKDCQTGDELKVLLKGDNKFGTTASKTFLTTENELGPVAVSISIASYRVVEVRLVLLILTKSQFDKHILINFFTIYCQHVYNHILNHYHFSLVKKST